MSLPSSRVPGLPTAKDDIDPGLLKKTQAYLKCQSQGRAAEGQLLEAWEQFYRTYDPLIRHFAVASRVPKASLNDCVQQVWTELVRKLGDFRHDPQRCRFRTWLYTLVHRRAIDLLRHRTSHSLQHLPPEVAAALCGRDEDPATAYQRQQEQAVVQQVLAELGKQVSARDARLLQLRWIESRTVAETATALGLTPPQVWLREHRLRRKFRRLFNSYTRGA
jgi:RNA polymerase sigma-70 factor (ECF subfamily)